MANMLAKYGGRKQINTATRQVAMTTAAEATIALIVVVVVAVVAGHVARVAAVVAVAAFDVT